MRHRSTFTLDLVASRGILGLIDLVLAGLECGSEMVHLSIFKFDPPSGLSCRSTVEALEADASLAPGAISSKASFAALGSGDNSLPVVSHTVLAQNSASTLAGLNRFPVSDVPHLCGSAQNIIVQRFRNLHAIDAVLIAPAHINVGMCIMIGLPIIHVPGAMGGGGQQSGDGCRSSLRQLRGDGESGDGVERERSGSSSGDSRKNDSSDRFSQNVLTFSGETSSSASEDTSARHGAVTNADSGPSLQPLKMMRRNLLIQFLK